MIITYHGADFFKVSFGDTIIAVNPISKDSKLKSTRFGSDITLISLINGLEHNGSDMTSRGEKESFVITGPGEYEISGVFIKGFLSKAGDHLNTIYTVSLENMNLCFLGGLGNPELGDNAKEAIEGSDVLFVPIGGESVLDPVTAHKLAVQSEAKLIIPSHYDDKSLKTFLKEAGEEKAEKVDKITLKKKDLEGKEGDVVVLEVS
jgi:L-ascorbate metabolism protein UlaG (beta-lactamase superfamily)